jgi:hypothetical protein
MPSGDGELPGVRAKHQRESRTANPHTNQTVTNQKEIV